MQMGFGGRWYWYQSKEDLVRLTILLTTLFKVRKSLPNPNYDLRTQLGPRGGGVCPCGSLSVQMGPPDI
jgi:hypothetical protein